MNGQHNTVANRRPFPAWLGLLALTLATAVIFSVVAVKLTLAFLVGLALLGVLLKRPDLTTLLVLFALYANLAVVAVRFSSVPPPLAVGFFVLLGIPLAYHVVLRRAPIVFDKTLWLMLAYLAVLLISAAFSRQPSQSADKIGQYVAEGILLYFLVVNTIRTPAMLRKVAWTLLLAGALMGLVTVYQRATRSYDHPLGGLAQVDQGNTDEGDDADQGGPVRQAGPIGEKNRFAQVLVVLLPFSIVLWRLASTRKVRLAAAACGLLILAGTMLTYSRGAAVAVFVLVAALAALRYLRPAHVLGLALAGLLLAVLVAPGYVARLTSLAGASDVEQGGRGTADSSLRGRLAENFAALRVFEMHPLLGVGPGQTRLYVAAYGNELSVKRLAGTRRGHNMYLEELADSGIVGFAVLMTIVGVTLRQLWKLRRRWLGVHPEYAELATGLLLSLTVYLTTAVFLHLSYQRYFWLLVALSGVAIHLLQFAPLHAPAERAAIASHPRWRNRQAI